MKTVKEMHQKAITEEKKMLSNYPAAWWAGYISNSSYFDRAFARLYKSFEFFDQEPDESIGDVLDNFIDAVYDHLLINDKRYAEMWRIQGLTDDLLPMTYNYDMTEIMDREVNTDGSNIQGQRTDVNNTLVGSQKTSDVEKVTAANSSTEKVRNTSESELGTRNDVSQFTKGQQGDTMQSKETEDYTLTRKGNIGVQTGADILMSFDKAMPVFNFYHKIFGEIATALLNTGRC